MKKIVKKTQRPTSDLHNVKDNMHVGILWKSGDKGFLFVEDDVNVICVDKKDLEGGGIPKMDRKIKYSTKRKYLRDCLNKHCAGFLEAYLFDSFDELYKWLTDEQK